MKELIVSSKVTKEIKILREQFNDLLDEKMQLLSEIEDSLVRVGNITYTMVELDDMINIKAGIYGKSE